MEKVQIPEELLAQFSNPSESDSPETEQQNKAVQEFTLGLAEQTAELFFSSFDEAMKSRELPGLGGIPGKDLAKLSVISLEDVLPAHVLENSPHWALVGIFSKIAGQNYLAYRRQIKNQSKEQAAENE